MSTTHGLTHELVKRIKTAIRVGRSARHVPAKVCNPDLLFGSMLDVLTVQILQVSDIPVTLTGKRVEVPIRKVSCCRQSTCWRFSRESIARGMDADTAQVINGASVSSINPATLRNPECLEEYASLGEKLRREAGM